MTDLQQANNKMDLFNGLTAKTSGLGIPYMGSKRKHADALLTRMLQEKPDAKYFYDLFGGGGAMSFAALEKGLTVFYNEKQTCLVNFIQFIFDCCKNPQSEYGIFPSEYYNFVTREMFMQHKNETGNYAQFVKVVYSFANNQKNYMFNKELEKIKNLAHNIIVFKSTDCLNALENTLKVRLSMPEGATLNDRRLFFRKQIIKLNRFDLKQLQQLERIEQLGRTQRLQEIQQLQQLQKLEQLEQIQQIQEKITFTNLDYSNVKITTPVDETIVYLDPPYRNTAKYIENLDHVGLDYFFKTLPYLAFMSEYAAPFKSILQIQTRSTFKPTSKTTQRVEKLFINKEK